MRTTVALLPSTKTSQGPLLMPSPVLKLIHNFELGAHVTNEKSQLSFETYCDTLLHGSGGSSQIISRLCRYPIRSSTLRNKMFGELTQRSKFSKSSCYLFPTPAVIIIRTSSHLHVVQGKKVSIYVLVMKRCWQ